MAVISRFTKFLVTLTTVVHVCMVGIWSTYKVQCYNAMINNNNKIISVSYNSINKLAPSSSVGSDDLQTGQALAIALRVVQE